MRIFAASADRAVRRRQILLASALLGSVLVAHHGQGVFVYTGLAFFRQLPAGVPGAYRLLANLLAVP